MKLSRFNFVHVSCTWIASNDDHGQDQAFSVQLEAEKGARGCCRSQRLGGWRLKKVEQRLNFKPICGQGATEVARNLLGTAPAILRNANQVMADNTMRWC